MVTAPAESDRLLKHRPFLLFWMARVFSSLGFQIASVTVGWLIYEKTGSAYQLGLAGLFQFLPMVTLTFLVGHVADRFDRRRIVLTCQAIEGLAMAALLVGETGGWLTVPGIFAGLVVIGAARAFEAPTNSAMLPGLLPPALLPRALAVSSSAMQTATILGPSLGGVLYAAGVAAPLSLSAVLFFAASLSVTAIRTERAAPRREPVTLRSVFSGVTFIRGNPLVLGTISLDLFAVLLGGVTALLPIFASDILHTGPWGLGLLRSAPAVGALVMAFVLVRVPLGDNVGIKMFVSVVVFGIATIVFSASENLALSVAALVVLGAADNVSVVIRNSLVLLSTPDEMRGRVNAVNSLFIGTSNQLGEFESGMVAGLIGAVPAGIIGGIGTILVALLWMRLFPVLRNARSLEG